MELRAKLIHQVIDAEERIAGTITRGRLDELYLAAELSPEEYLEILLACGWSEPMARQALQDAHDRGAPEHWPQPPAAPPVQHLPEYKRPGRRPAKIAAGGPKLTGHPLDEQ